MYIYYEYYLCILYDRKTGKNPDSSISGPLVRRPWWSRGPASPQDHQLLWPHIIYLGREALHHHVNNII